MPISEIELVERLRSLAERGARGRHPSLRRGIGDDCAVIASSRNCDLLITTDLFLEDVHFRSEWNEPASAGHKTLARGLSDIAAMGGVPRYVFLSLGLPRRWRAGSLDAFDEFFKGFFALAQRTGVVLAGGDTGASPRRLVADIVVVGETPRRQAVLRSGARPGDQIWVTGQLGLASVGLGLLQHSGARRKAAQQPRTEFEAAALRAFLFPEPRLRAGQWLRQRKLPSAMMDLSDGLSLDLARLCQESGVAARVYQDRIPRTPQTPLRNALHGGEDLELLFTVRPRHADALPRRIGGLPLTRIGEIVAAPKRGPRVVLVSGDKERPLPAKGFQHF